MTCLTIEGIPTHVTIRGSGKKTLVLLHGAGGSSHHFMYVNPPEGWRLAAIDLPGHGQTGGEARSDIFTYATWVVECINTLGGCDILAGHSMGGAITMALALTNPELVSGLILIGTGAKLGVSRSILELCSRSAVNKLEDMLATLAYGPLPSIAQIREWHQISGSSPSRTYLHDFNACNGFDIRSRLADIRLPVLIINGLEDKLTPVAYAQYLATHLPDAQLIDVPLAGHMVMLEQPEHFNRAVATFCSRFS